MKQGHTVSIPKVSGTFFDKMLFMSDRWTNVLDKIYGRVCSTWGTNDQVMSEREGSQMHFTVI